LLALLPPVSSEVTPSWEPVHTLYAGAHLFSPERIEKIGLSALDALRDYDSEGEWFGSETHRYLERKLDEEPVEDYRIDFEDGFGLRSDDDEDRWAIEAGRSLRGSTRVPPRIGLRVRSLGLNWAARALRTLSLFLSHAGDLPVGFRLTIPKVEHPLQVRLIRRALRLLGVDLALELMVESPVALTQIPDWLDEAEGLCRAVHFGPNDFLASCGVLEGELHHLLCKAARERLLFEVRSHSAAVALADGPTTRLPIPLHRGALTEEQRGENRDVVRAAWDIHRDDLRRSWRQGYTQSWDLHPAQLVSHHAEVYETVRRLEPFYRARLDHFEASSGQAVHTRTQFDDQATIRILENFFLKFGRA
jgi:hypothetical protein